MMKASLRGGCRNRRREFEDARTKLKEAGFALELAEKACEAAEDVYNAAIRDVHRPTTSPSQQTLQWLALLPTDSVFTHGDMEAAAATLDWSIKPDALRQTIKRMADSGIFERVGRGEYRLKGEKVLALGIHSSPVQDSSSEAVQDTEVPDADVIASVRADDRDLGHMAGEVENEPEGAPSSDTDQTGSTQADEPWRDEDAPF